MESIRIRYNGVLYRSKLEATTAKLFDEYNIKFIYEPDVIEFRDGTKYMPDFYLPEQKIWVECKGLMNDKDEHKITMLANESKEKEVIIITSDGHFSLVQAEGDTLDEVLWLGEEDVFFAHCKKCGKWYFSDTAGSWACRHCGFHDGNSTFDFSYFGEDGFPESDFQFDVWEDAD